MSRNKFNVITIALAAVLCIALVFAAGFGVKGGTVATAGGIDNRNDDVTINNGGIIIDKGDGGDNSGLISSGGDDDDEDIKKSISVIKAISVISTAEASAEAVS